MARASPGNPVRPHQLDALERFHGPDEQRGGRSLGFGDHVEAVVHPIHKVHVGMPWRTEHHPVASRFAEPRVGRSIGLADVRLELDDPARPPSRFVVTDEPRAEQSPPGFEGGSRQDRPIGGAQPERG